MRRIAFVLLLWLVQAACANAQTDSLLPAIAKPDSNFLRFPSGNTQALHRFCLKLDSVLLHKKGRVNVLHIGGSHVQADMYTEVMRQGFDTIVNNFSGPRGFLVPYSVARTNNPFNYRVRYGGEWGSARNAIKQFYPTQGLSGIAVYTTDTAAWLSVKMNIDTLSRWHTNDVHVFGRAEHGTCRPLLSIADSITLRPESEPTGYRFRLPCDVDSFRVSIEFDNVSAVADTFVITGFYADNDQPGVVYNTVGVNGASVPSYLGCPNFATDLAVLKPDLAVFALGINDATAHDFTDSLFCANYNVLISRIRAVAPNCELLFITNNDSYQRSGRRRYRVNTNGEVARRGFYALAKQWDAALWDLYEVMGGPTSMSHWQELKLARKDKVHFTRRGYQIVGSMLLQAIYDYYIACDCYNPDLTDIEHAY